jgi:ABC-type transport system involved in Fe-S cluster assembly fused permease/ATPase subunit
MVVIKEGCMVETGTHTELISKGEGMPIACNSISPKI